MARGGRLSEEDRALWQRVRDSIRPLDWRRSLREALGVRDSASASAGDAATPELTGAPLQPQAAVTPPTDAPPIDAPQAQGAQPTGRAAEARAPSRRATRRTARAATEAADGAARAGSDTILPWTAPLPEGSDPLWPPPGVAPLAATGRRRPSKAVAAGRSREEPAGEPVLQPGQSGQPRLSGQPQQPGRAAPLRPVLPPYQAPSPSGTAVTRLARLDAPALRRLERGRARIEARLDLHGMTQADAYAALLHFVTDARLRGRRLVLVIPGKGPGGEGVLRRSVPAWLAGPQLAAHVAAWSPARPRHGGEGALYLRLRTP